MVKWEPISGEQNGQFLEIGDGTVRFEILQREAVGRYRGFVHVSDKRWKSEGVMVEDVAKLWCESKFRNIVREWQHRLDNIIIERLGMTSQKGTVIKNGTTN